MKLKGGQNTQKIDNIDENIKVKSVPTSPIIQVGIKGYIFYCFVSYQLVLHIGEVGTL